MRPRAGSVSSAIKIKTRTWQQIKASELVRPRAEPKTPFVTRTFSFNQDQCDRVRVWTQATSMRWWNTHAHCEKIRDCACGLGWWNTHAHCEKIPWLRMRIEVETREWSSWGGRAGPKEETEMHTRSKHCCGSGHGRASLGKGSWHTRREASCQIRTARGTKASFKKVERSTHGPGSPVHTASSEEEHITTPVSDTATFISKFAGSWAWYPKGFKAVKQGWWNITKAANFHSKTTGKPTIFGALLHKTGISLAVHSSWWFEVCLQSGTERRGWTNLVLKPAGLRVTQANASRQDSLPDDMQRLQCFNSCGPSTGTWTRKVSCP